MTIWEAIILGLIQGLTEFLPISSSGHLVLFQNLFNISESALSFDIVVHLATLISVIAVLFQEIKKLFLNPFSKLTVNIIISAIPAAVIVFVFEAFLKASFGGNYLGWGFMISAIFLLIGDFISQKPHKRLLGNNGLDQITVGQAFIMGVFQGIAVFPGISRSGSTISAGLVAGQDRETAAKFSFLMSIPVVLGAVVVDIIDIGVVNVDIGAGAIIAGFLSALVSGFFSAKIMLKIVSNHAFWGFSVYLVLMSLLSFLLL